MDNNDFIWFLNWFNSHCNNDWEHGRAIRIETLDNPGWSISVELEQTELEFELFETTDVSNSDNDWWTCFVQNSKFEGRCGPLNLIQVIRIFRNWYESILEGKE